MRTPLLLAIFDSIGQKIHRNNFDKTESTVNDALDAEIKILSENEGDLANIIDHLFIQRTKNPEQYFEIIGEVQAYLHFNKSSIILSGSVFLYWLKNMEEDEKHILFNKIKDTKTFHVWNVIRILPIVLSKYEMNSTYAAEWFLIVGESIKHDLASGSFFESIANYANSFPNLSFKVLENYISEELRDLRLDIASIIVGTYRINSLTVDFHINGKKIDDYFHNHYHVRFRILFYRSWITSFRNGDYSVEEIISLLEYAVNGEIGEVDEAFNVANRLLSKGNITENSIHLIIQWLLKYSSPSLSNISKYCIVNSIYYLFTTKHFSSVESFVIQSNEIFKKILPLPFDNKGTWNDVDLYLNEVFKNCPQQITDTLKIFNNFAPNIFQQLIEAEQFDSFIYQFVGEKADAAIFILLFSQDQRDRKIAYSFLRKKKKIIVQHDSLEMINEMILEKILDEFTAQIFLGEETAMFFQFMEPLFVSLNENLKKKFINEMVFQAVNYPGACLDEWKKITPRTDILKEVIDRADNYFQQLKEVDELPAINFKSYEIEKAVVLEMRIKSRILNKGVKEKSIFYNLARHIQILYGKKWTIQNGTSEDSPRELNVISHTVEFPRIEFIDPEGIFLRRYNKKVWKDNEQ